MAVLTCNSPRYIRCDGVGEGSFQRRLVSGQGSWSLNQNKSRLVTTNIGGIAVTLQSRERNFMMATAGSWSKTGYFIYQCGDETEAYAYCDCFTFSGSNTESLSESYQTIDTIIAYLDLRFGLALCKEVKDSLAFSPSTSGLAQFIGPYGVTYTHKFRMNVVDLNRQTTYYAIYGGEKHALATKNEITHIHTKDNPLILISAPMPPEYIPNDPEIEQYGFYDYGNDPGLVMSDGGNDFYYTEWMRLCGTANQIQDADDAAFRYQNFYLYPGLTSPPVAPAVPLPALSLGGPPEGTILQDKNGNVCYSWGIDGQVFNFITGGDLQVLTKVEGTNFKAYPVGII